MVKKIVGWAVLAYGILLAVLGYVGGGAGSKISFYVGIGSGAVMVLAALLIFLQTKAGTLLSLVMTMLLSIVFAARYLISGKMITAVLAILSASFFLYFLVHTVRWRKARK